MFHQLYVEIVTNVVLDGTRRHALDLEKDLNDVVGVTSRAQGGRVMDVLEYAALPRARASLIAEKTSYCIQCIFSCVRLNHESSRARYRYMAFVLCTVSLCGTIRFT